METVMILVTTETGSKYEFDFDQMRTRRINETKNFTPLRKDDEWNQLVTVPEIVTGQPMRFALMVREDDIVTIRHTSYVTKVEEV
jgi:hypothetical protein